MKRDGSIAFITNDPHLLPGNETKLGMSRGVPEPKLTAMDAMIDKLTGAIFLFQLTVVVVLGAAGNVWKDMEARKQWYVKYDDNEPWYQILVIPLRFELLCSIMIPISIKVSLDFVKSLYAKFIDWDEHMYDLENDIPAHAANTAISEDLGQVEYILTDKTETLIENKMIFWQIRAFISWQISKLNQLEHLLVLFPEEYIHVILLVVDFVGCDVHKHMVYKTNSFGA
ncbi:phospholipid-transporting ATPase 2-like isoform X2 [Miscanthus floridulus]|uniref:phospholipid-transporting ATPase 2-like isoform X2 n=1 Tax=Miscanthus floridulus TaxID=154761 RepID=UPI003459E4F0